MNSAELKKKLSRLWKDTFHDSDEYISLIFDNYFDPQFAEYEVSDGEVVAGLIGIPYNFGNKENCIKALYLCGLATKSQFRSRGIMTKLLSNINEKAKNAGFAFSFLIPADEGLRKFYRERDYVNAFYRVVDNYTSLHDFDREYDSFLLEQKEKVAELKKHYYDSLKSGIISASCTPNQESIDGIKSLIRSIEDCQNDLQIIHSDQDVELLIRENIVSRGSVHFVKNSSGNVTAVAFVTPDEYEVNIHKIYASDVASKYKVLGSVKMTYPERAICHFVPSIEMDSKTLWSRSYGSFAKDAPQINTISMTERVYSLAAHSKVYGMARVLDLESLLRFQAELSHELRYSVMMKSTDVYTFDQIEVRDGNLKMKKLAVESLLPSQTAHVMSRHDIGEILFRRRDTDNLITEAFGIPSINGAISLLLD